MEVWHIWVIVALVFVIVEMFTSGFAVMCISFGCIFGAVASALDWELKWQLLVFAIGTALALEPNTMSAPVKGTNGVYVLTVGEKKVAEGALDATQEIQQLNMRTSYSLPYQAVSLIEEKAEVVDNRARFQ